MSVTGPAGHGNVGSQAPVPIGGVAATSPPAAVDAGDAVNAYFDENGWQHVIVEVRGANNTNSVLGVVPNVDGLTSLINTFSSTTYTLVYNGATWDRIRTPAIFKPLASTAITAGTGATAWDPAAGKKFRVMGLSYSSSAAGQLILGDALAATVIARSPTLAAGGTWQLGAADLGNGILSAAANNNLIIDGPTGNVAGMVWGTEE